MSNPPRRRVEPRTRPSVRALRPDASPGTGDAQAERIQVGAEAQKAREDRFIDLELENEKKVEEVHRELEAECGVCQTLDEHARHPEEHKRPRDAKRPSIAPSRKYPRRGLPLSPARREA